MSDKLLAKPLTEYEQKYIANLWNWFSDKITKEEYEIRRDALRRRRVYFLREKIICLQKLLEIPESWDEVYYARKSVFMELLKKL